MPDSCQLSQGRVRAPRPPPRLVLMTQGCGGGVLKLGCPGRALGQSPGVAQLLLLLQVVARQARGLAQSPPQVHRADDWEALPRCEQEGLPLDERQEGCGVRLSLCVQEQGGASHRELHPGNNSNV